MWQYWIMVFGESHAALACSGVSNVCVCLSCCRLQGDCYAVIATDLCSGWSGPAGKSLTSSTESLWYPWSGGLCGPPAVLGHQSQWSCNFWCHSTISSLIFMPLYSIIITIFQLIIFFFNLLYKILIYNIYILHLIILTCLLQYGTWKKETLLWNSYISHKMFCFSVAFKYLIWRQHLKFILKGAKMQFLQFQNRLYVWLIFKLMARYHNYTVMFLIL